MIVLWLSPSTMFMCAFFFGKNSIKMIGFLFEFISFGFVQFLIPLFDRNDECFFLSFKAPPDYVQTKALASLFVYALRILK